MALGLTGLLGIIAAFMIFFFIVGIVVYIYTSLALMFIAKRTNTPHGWMAWIPYLSSYLTAKIARANWWPVLILVVVSILGLFSQNTIISIISGLLAITFAVFNIIWWWNICKMRGKPGWWVLITIIPLIGWAWGLVMVGILAWGKEETSVPTPTAPQPVQSNPPA